MTLCRYFKAQITGNSFLNSHFKLLSITASPEITIPKPGQFYMLQVGHSYDPLLKRPFSIYSHEDNVLKFLYRIRGKGTLSLSQLKAGDVIRVIGPIGNSYPEPEGDFIAVAGGIGIASLFPLLERHKNKAYLFYGARNRDELVMLDEAGAVSKEIFIATDDGSNGKKGLLTEMVEEFLDSYKDSNELPVYTCGPAPMMRELSRIIEGRGIKCYASLEEHMACGVGACLGCIVKTASGQKRVCKEGPVFDIEEIVW